MCQHQDSLAVTPAGKSPATATRISWPDAAPGSASPAIFDFRGDAGTQGAERRHASRVCESPQYDGAAGQGEALFRPDDMDDALRISSIAGIDGEIAAFFSSVATWIRDSSSAIPADRSVVAHYGRPPPRWPRDGAVCGRGRQAFERLRAWSPQDEMTVDYREDQVPSSCRVDQMTSQILSKSVRRLSHRREVL